MKIETALQEYIVENFMYSGDGEELKSDLELFEAGIIDSTGVLELVSFLEEEFEIQVEDTEMVPDNFASIDQLAAFIRKKSA